MIYGKLDLKNVDKYIRYLQLAMVAEPDEMTIESVDSEQIKETLTDPFYQNCESILAIDNGEVVGRIEYHFYGCVQGGYRMAYVSWVYVLPQERHKGIAQKLFSLFEDECRKNRINQYRLIRSTNPNASRFYNSFKNVELVDYPVLNRYFE